MSAQTKTFVASGTWTAPALLLGTTVTAYVNGASGGDGGAGAQGGNGAVVIGTVTVIAGTTTLTATLAHHAGGVAGSGGGGSVAGAGGASSALLNGATLLIEAAGGGGAADDPTDTGGVGGTPNGGTANQSATGDGPGKGATLSADGAGGTGTGGSGSPGSAGVGGAGKSISGDNGGGGGGGYKGGGGGCRSGGGGGSSYVDASVGGVSEVASNTVPVCSITLVYEIIDAPLAPTLVSPANASFIDSNAVGVVFTGTYNPNSGSGTLKKIALRRSTDGGSYGYWNGTNFSASTPQWITPTTGFGVGVGGTFTESIPAAVLADGHNYAWSFACEESFASQQGVFAPDDVFTAATIPTINSLVPSGTATTTTPTVAWTETLGGGDSQISYRYMVYAAPAVPGQPGPVYDSGVVTGAALSFALPSSAGLVNGATYYSYLQIVETGGAPSQWYAASFTVSIDGPATPTLIATPLTTAEGQPYTSLAMSTSDNLLSAEDSSFEEGTTGDFAASNATLTNSAAWAADGDLSLQASSTASGTVVMNSVTGTAGVPVTPGQVVTAMGIVQQPSLTQTVELFVAFYNSSGTFISSLLAATGSASAGGTALTGQVTAPAGAAYMSILYEWAATGASQITRVDEQGLFLGVVSAWTVGGFIGSLTAEFQYSDDDVTWYDVRFSSDVAVVNESAAATDYELIQGSTRYYRVRTVAIVGGQTLPSSWSNVVTNIVALGTQWFIADPLTPGSGIAFDLDTQAWQPSVHEEETVYYPIGRSFGVKSSSGTKGIGGQVVATTTTVEQLLDILALIEEGSTLYLQAPFASWYVTASADTSGSMTATTAGVAEFTQTQTTITYIQVAKP